MHRSQQHVERVAGQEGGDVVHAVLVEVDLEPDDHGQARRLGLERAGHVLVEIGRGVEAPVLGHGLGQRGRHPLVVPETAEQGFGLAEAEEMLGHRQLLHPGRLGPLAIVGQLLHPQRSLVLAVGPEMEVVVEHVVGRLRPVSSPCG